MRLAYLLPLLVVSLSLPLLAALSDEDWQRVTREAGEVAEKPGEAVGKTQLLQDLQKEDSARVAKLLLELAVKSDGVRAKVEHDLEKAEARYSKINRKLIQRYGRSITQALLEADPEWREAKNEVQTLRDAQETELTYMGGIVEAIGALKSTEAATALVDKSDRAAREAHKLAEVRNGILDALWHQPAAQFEDEVIAFAQDKDLPNARARALTWIGKQKLRKGYDVAVDALKAEESAVARAAVAALKEIDDPRCVPVLIQARSKAAGLLAEEIELTLHHFTGQDFYGSGADTMYRGWWRSNGSEWLRNAQATRYGTADLQRKGSASFYGIETRSNRIVFVLDRSASMLEPVPHHGPVSGGDTKEEPVPGDTRIEVAKNQLIRSIQHLQGDVKFAVIFYSHDVTDWQPPPTLVPATPENKEKAVAWVSNVQAVGSTMIFDALREALQYAKVGGGKGETDPLGADTIFLLSDGAPSTPDGSALLPPGEIEAEIKKFLEANAAFRCVVHTIGVGPEHNRELMQRLARETGGTYKAVGMK